jgi:hypothetical protein
LAKPGQQHILAARLKTGARGGGAELIQAVGGVDFGDVVTGFAHQQQAVVLAFQVLAGNIAIQRIHPVQ